SIEAMRLSCDPELIAHAKLPRLRRLVTTHDQLPALHTLARRAPWWSQLERITLTAGPMDLPLLLPVNLKRELPPVPSFAIACAGENGEPAGWRLAFGPDDVIEAAAVGWHPETTLRQLIELLRRHPRTPITLTSTRYWAFSDEDRDDIARALRRPIAQD